MNRRKLLQLFSAIPFIGIFLEDPADASQERTVFLPTPPELDWGRLANQLSINLNEHLNKQQASGEERYFLQQVCYYFCKNLQNWELSANFFPEQKIDALSDVQFAVMNNPIEAIVHPNTGENVVLTAHSRKMRVFRFGDVLPQEANFIAAGEQAALDIQLELRHQIKEGRPVRVFAIYVPPFLSSAAHVPKDFSVHRGFLIRYAKVFK
jgi:hypothetical protein